jgi:3D (Asp-Asp-Asp) domain-containing protein
MRRSGSTIALVCLLLILLTSCTQGNLYSKYKGTDGLLISFPKNSPPETVYEDRPFPVKFELHNAGAQNVSFKDMLITFNTDPLYIGGGLSVYLPDKHGILVDGELRQKNQLFGRSEIYPNGEKWLFGIPTESAFVAKLVPGQRESPKTTLLASVCYPYMTFVSAEVCIDTNIYQENQRKQSCTQQDVTLSGGQGGPIAVTQIEVSALPVIGTDRTETIRPQFIIHIEDVGKGYLVGPASLNMAEACLLRNIPKEELNTVRVQASLLKSKLVCGNSKIKTTEGLVKLEDGKGEIICTVADDELNNPIYRSTQNFQSALTINISYLYKSSVTKEITIQRQLGRTTDTPRDDFDVITGYAYEGDKLVRDASGYPVTLCQWYEEKPERAPEPIASFMKEKAFSCACDAETCSKGMGTDCFAALCGGSTYCCTTVKPSTLYDCPNTDGACKGKQGMFIDDYLKSGSTADQCVYERFNEFGQSPSGTPMGGTCWVCDRTKQRCGSSATSNSVTSGTTPGTVTSTPLPTGAGMTVRSTVYYLPNCADFSSWSTTNNPSLTGPQACKIPLASRGFYEDVKCQGTGYCDGKYYRYNTIKITKETSPTSTGAYTKCQSTPEAHRTIAVNAQPGTPCYIPLNSKVRIDFGGDSWDGEYIAEDIGASITGCHIDVYVGEGKTELQAGKNAVDGYAKVSIIEKGDNICPRTGS